MWNSDRRASSLRQLHTLNRHFVSHLLALEHVGIAGPSIAPDLIAQLRALDAAALHDLCSTPFTLYYLPFGNETYWQETARLRTASDAAGHGFGSAEDPIRELTKMALFLAWHVACTDAAGARLFFGMASGTLAFFRQTDVATLSGVAIEAAQVLQPRWQTNPCFWPDLLKSAGRDRVRMQAARLLGAQLLAAEQHGEHVVQQMPRRLRVSVMRRSTSEPVTVSIEQPSLAAFAPLA